jgi:hypothetical protein
LTVGAGQYSNINIFSAAPLRIEHFFRLPLFYSA